jgi:hypothetical protein
VDGVDLNSNPLHSSPTRSLPSRSLALGKPKEGIPEGRKKLDEGSAFDPE